jgi:hypothetical protein
MLKKGEWGPILWKFLHACSFAFPKNPTKEESLAFDNLLNSLKKLVPCPECREHYCNYLEDSPPPNNDGEKIQKWLVDFHNSVNKRTGKPEISFDAAKNIHSVGRNWYKILFYITLILLIFLIIYIIYFSFFYEKNK